MTTPILATDYTGAMEGLLWFVVNVLVAFASLVVWSKLCFPKTRDRAVEHLTVLVRCGWALLFVVALQIYPNVFERRPPHWESVFWLAGISLALFFGSWVLRRLMTRKKNRND